MDLISLQQEGGYWDFKEKWYSDNADLLLDIICLANNLQDRDAYIIIGVKDNDCSIVGTQNDPNRKNTQNIVDFLEQKKFAGENRPTVTVEPLLEEVMSDLMDPLAKQLAGMDWEGYDLDEILYDYLIGATVGGLSGSGKAVSGGYAQENAEARQDRDARDEARAWEQATGQRLSGTERRELERFIR